MRNILEMSIHDSSQLSLKSISEGGLCGIMYSLYTLSDTISNISHYAYNMSIGIQELLHNTAYDYIIDQYKDIVPPEVLRSNIYRMVDIYASGNYLQTYKVDAVPFGNLYEKTNQDPTLNVMCNNIKRDVKILPIFKLYFVQMEG